MKDQQLWFLAGTHGGVNGEVRLCGEWYPSHDAAEAALAEAKMTLPDSVWIARGLHVVGPYVLVAVEA